MRTAIAIIMVSLILGLGYGPSRAETSAGWLGSIHMFDALTGWAVDAEGHGGVAAKGAVESVVRTTDGGVHWRDVTPHAPPGQKLASLVLQVDWFTSLIAWVELPLDNPTRTPLLFRTVDGGRTWTHATIPSYASIDFVDDRNGWLMSGRAVVTKGTSCPCGEEADIYRSTDGGETWTKVASTRANDERSGLPFAGSKKTITFLNTTTGWITGTRDPGDASPLAYLYVTNDGGHSWRLQELPPLPLTVPYRADAPTMRFFTAQDGILSSAYSVPNTVHPVAFGVVFYVTHDRGTTWTSTTPPFATPLTTSPDISQEYQGSSFADVDHGWVVTYGGTLYVTSDSGHHWTIRSRLNRVPVGQIDFVSPQLGWAVGQGNDFAYLEKTVDGGHTWSPVAYTISR